MFYCPARLMLQQTAVHRSTSVKLYQWEFTHLPSWVTCPGIFCNQVPWKVAHFSECSFVFGTDYTALGATGMTAAEEALSATMRSFWVAFAATGSPAPAVKWPLWSLSAESYLQFDVPIRIGTHFKQRQCTFWNDFGRTSPASSDNTPSAVWPGWNWLIGGTALVAVAAVLIWFLRSRRLTAAGQSPQRAGPVDTSPHDAYHLLRTGV